MPNRKEPQLNLNPSTEPSYSVKSEEPAAYVSSQVSQASVEPSEENTPAARGFSLLAALALVLSLAALALGAWLFLAANQQAQKSEQQFNRLVGRLEEIELALADTGKNLNQTGTSLSGQFADVKEQLALHFSEIDKLSGVRKQTRLALEELDKTTAQHTSQLKQQQTSLTSSNNQLKQLETRTASQLGELNLVTSTLREDLTQLKQLNQQLASLKERLAKLEKTAASQELNLVKAQLNEQQELLRSLETSRNQLVQRLTKLDAEMQALQN